MVSAGWPKNGATHARCTGGLGHLIGQDAHNLSGLQRRMQRLEPLAVGRYRHKTGAFSALTHHIVHEGLAGWTIKCRGAGDTLVAR